jgi:hypothetical protein
MNLTPDSLSARIATFRVPDRSRYPELAALMSRFAWPRWNGGEPASRVNPCLS